MKTHTGTRHHDGSVNTIKYYVRTTGRNRIALMDDSKTFSDIEAFKVWALEQQPVVDAVPEDTAEQGTGDDVDPTTNPED